MDRALTMKAAIAVASAALLSTIYPTDGRCASVEQETLARIERLRQIVPDATRADAFNKQMDEAWAFFDKNKKEVLPILKRELEAEAAKPRPSDMVLLDVGHYLARRDAASKASAKRALLKLNTAAEIVQWNYEALFNLAYAVADEPDDRLLAFMDRTFLTTSREVFVPQHALTLGATLQCVFLYGKQGPRAEAHLRQLLANPAQRNRVLEILIWIGSPESVDAVNRIMSSARDYDTFVRTVAFMMTIGGPDGRAAMLSLKPDALDSRAREYYDRVIKDVRAVTFDALSAQLDRGSGDKKLSDDQVKARLAAMYENFGKDDRTHPSAILGSTLPKKFLIDELTKIRSRMFFRLSNEALTDVKMTNIVINALRYRQF